MLEGLARQRLNILFLGRNKFPSSSGMPASSGVDDLTWLPVFMGKTHESRAASTFRDSFGGATRIVRFEARV
jgi:hypothetical protein